MGLKADLEGEVKAIFGDEWETRKGEKVPEPGELRLNSNDAVTLDATVLYADIASSTDLVDARDADFAAEVYEAYLRCAARIIKDEAGTITAYDGDRVMAVYIGGLKNTSAVRAALKINYAVQEIITPLLKKQYGDETYKLRQVVGIDTSELWIARIGVRNNNDLVWVGRAANYAAKLCSMNGTPRTYITEDVYRMMKDEVKHSGKDKTPMWKQVNWPARPNITVYGSTWWWRVD